ncbi:hypothetical protein RF11_08925 [Thelohanellus kitauei]|uniref:Uncharacterized protein n=1 Tax=Thelohanellus kitauei TaxID=669202 RepID=A0A0C2MM96_THEKT|nr:hypothetical protein RF11_08925 [Thelohanellus kitauei]
MSGSYQIDIFPRYPYYLNGDLRPTAATVQIVSRQAFTALVLVIAFSSRLSECDCQERDRNVLGFIFLKSKAQDPSSVTRNYPQDVMTNLTEIVVESNLKVAGILKYDQGSVDFLLTTPGFLIGYYTGDDDLFWQQARSQTKECEIMSASLMDCIRTEFLQETEDFIKNRHPVAYRTPPQQ